jgi:hypothetical protein
MSINIDRFVVVGNDIVERSTGEIIYSSVPSNIEINFHCDVLNGRVSPKWITPEHLMWIRT